MLPQHLLAPKSLPKLNSDFKGRSPIRKEHGVQEPSFNSIPNLDANLDLSRSFDFCAMNTKNLLIPNSFYSQWDVDVDDLEERKILEGLKGGTCLRSRWENQEESLALCKQSKDRIELDVQRRSYNDHQHDIQLSRPTETAFQEIEYNPIWSAQKKEANSKLHFKNHDGSQTTKLEKLLAKRTKSIGDTVESEFIQGHVPDVQSASKVHKEASLGESNKIFEAETERNGVIKENSETSSINCSELEALQRKHQEILSSPTTERFNVMIVGAAGLGKSTFIDAFLNHKYETTSPIRPPTEEIVERQGIKRFNHINFVINLIDTPGYRPDSKMDRWENIIKNYITGQFHAYKQDKSKVKNTTKKMNRRNNLVVDTRVHVVLYFLAGHRNIEEDLRVMNKLQQFCNIIPVIARGDSYTLQEVHEIKRQFMQDAQKNRIEFFDIYEALKDSPKKLKQVTDGKFGPCPPFLLISSIKKIEVSHQQFIYGRQYPWGLCNIENPQHSDFMLLRALLGGYICLEAIQLTKCFYKAYFREFKALEREKLENSKGKKMSTIMAVTLVGALFTLGRKFLN